MGERFATTRWSLVLAAGGERPDARTALSELCQLYWYPVYAFIRRRRAGGHAAALDLTQEFFTRLLEKSELSKADPARGRFRNWLLRRVKSFLASDWEWNTAQKRDQRKLTSLDAPGLCSHSDPAASAAESRYAREPTHQVDPERLYERNWTYALLERTLKLLEAHCEQRGKERLFAQVQHLLIGPEGDLPTYEPHAQALGMPAGTLKVYVHRLREDLRRILETQIAEIVDDPSLIQSELDALLCALTPER